MPLSASIREDSGKARKLELQPLIAVISNDSEAIPDRETERAMLKLLAGNKKPDGRIEFRHVRVPRQFLNTDELLETNELPSGEKRSVLSEELTEEPDPWLCEDEDSEMIHFLQEHYHCTVTKTTDSRGRVIYVVYRPDNENKYLSEEQAREMLEQKKATSRKSADPESVSPPDGMMIITTPRNSERVNMVALFEDLKNCEDNWESLAMALQFEQAEIYEIKSKTICSAADRLKLTIITWLDEKNDSSIRWYELVNATFSQNSATSKIRRNILSDLSYYMHTKKVLGAHAFNQDVQLIEQQQGPQSLAVKHLPPISKPAAVPAVGSSGTVYIHPPCSNSQCASSSAQENSQRKILKAVRSNQKEIIKAAADSPYDPPPGGSETENSYMGGSSLRILPHGGQMLAAASTPRTQNNEPTNTNKTILPKRSCIVSNNQQFPLTAFLFGHPQMDYFFVKERKEVRPSHFLAKLVLKHANQIKDEMEDDTVPENQAQLTHTAGLIPEVWDSTPNQAITERKHFPANLNRPGFVVFSSDLTRFFGNIKYPLPSRVAADSKIGKGGNGYVFLIYHKGVEYAVKKTVYRPNEIRTHAQLNHSNLVNLHAVLIGTEHERHRGKYYAYHFMTKCDIDFRSVISTKQHGCLKHLKLQLAQSEKRDEWQLVMRNLIYVFRSVLNALAYMHKQGLVHRDVKASNILLLVNCNCKSSLSENSSAPLYCACPKKYGVLLGDFDSSTNQPGHGLNVEPHQMIRYASILPLGTPGYRAPEVSIHIVLSGPYEVLYTTAVDIWSFGCLLHNLLIGKTGPTKQRGESSLLLARDNPAFEELYEKIIKVKELKKYYSDMPELVALVQNCLQVAPHCRPKAKQLLELDILKGP